MADEMTATAVATNSTGEETKAQEGVVSSQGPTGETGQQGEEGAKAPSSEVLTAEAIERLAQSKADKLTAELGKKAASLQKELERMKREKMSKEEIEKLELAEREREFAEKERALLERENRLYAIKAMKEIGLDDGSQKTLDLVDFIMADTEEAIMERAKAFKALVDRFVTAQVDKTFKANGRTPNSGNGGKGGAKPADNSIAAKLGQQAADTAKKSNNILDYYYGGKKQ